MAFPSERTVQIIKVHLPGWYQKYLRSPAWQARRDRIVAERKTCEVCGDDGSEDYLQVHHLSYEHLFDEPDEELLLVCDFCHERIHFLQGRGTVNFGNCRESFYLALDQFLGRASRGACNVV